jgi:hypothetical protein
VRDLRDCGHLSTVPLPKTDCLKKLRTLGYARKPLNHSESARAFVQTQKVASFAIGLGQPLVRFQNGHVIGGSGDGFDADLIMDVVF